MSEEKVLVKCIKKDQSGATVQSLSGNITQHFSWKMFNECFYPTDEEFIYEMIVPEEYEATVNKYAKKIEFVQENLHFILIGRATNFDDPKWLEKMSMLGGVFEKYMEEFPDSSILDFIEIFHKVCNAMGLKLLPARNTFIK